MREYHSIARLSPNHCHLNYTQFKKIKILFTIVRRTKTEFDIELERIVQNDIEDHPWIMWLCFAHSTPILICTLKTSRCANVKTATKLIAIFLAHLLQANAIDPWILYMFRSSGTPRLLVAYEILSGTKMGDLSGFLIKIEIVN